MRSTVTTLFLASLSRVYAQTYTSCNPLTATCPADPALGSTLSADFTKGPASRFIAGGTTGNIAYDGNGVNLKVAGHGDSPMLASDFYIMFGKVDVVMQAAPGTGIVSSIVLQSDDLDEVDWEFLGGTTIDVQTNYFGKGYTGSYDRAAFLPVSNPQTSFHTYTVTWTSDAITWSIDGTPLRTLAYATSEDAGGHFPQTPMQVKLGVWAGGDSSNTPGTINWAGGPTDYSQGPFTMIVKSVNVEDYSTGDHYQYNGNSGSWQSISAVNGNIGSSGPAAGGSSPPSPIATAPATTLTSIPLSNGLPSTFTTSVRGSRPTSGTDYWAGTGYHVSSASTSAPNAPPPPPATTKPVVMSTPTAAQPNEPPVVTTTAVTPASRNNDAPWWTPSTTYSNAWWTQFANAEGVAKPTPTHPSSGEQAAASLETQFPTSPSSPSPSPSSFISSGSVDVSPTASASAIPSVNKGASPTSSTTFGDRSAGHGRLQAPFSFSSPSSSLSSLLGFITSAWFAVWVFTLV